MMAACRRQHNGLHGRMGGSRGMKQGKQATVTRPGKSAPGKIPLT
jgi:hypothetical protein